MKSPALMIAINMTRITTIIMVIVNELDFLVLDSCSVPSVCIPCVGFQVIDCVYSV